MIIIIHTHFLSFNINYNVDNVQECIKNIQILNNKFKDIYKYIFKYVINL